MKQALILSAVLTSACQPGYYVLGDSLSSQSFSWVRQVTTHNMMSIAMPGLTVEAATFPSWLGPTSEIKGLIIFLGTNDVGSGVSTEAFRFRLSELVVKAQNQGLEVICVEIPGWNNFPDLDKASQPYRSIQYEVCPEVINIAITDEVMADSPDGAHWGPKGHKLIAEQMEYWLNERSES